jgi:hypothetical protein
MAKYIALKNIEDCGFQFIKGKIYENKLSQYNDFFQEKINQGILAIYKEENKMAKESNKVEKK